MTTHTPRLFLDCDGVLADFDHLAQIIFGMPGQEFEDRFGSSAFWNALRDHEPGFFNSLPLMKDGMRLWRAVRENQPTILTGRPIGDWAEPQKREWAAANFGEDAPIIVCRAADKKLHMTGPGDVLVDDMLKYRDLWEEAGGTFVHHTSIESTLAALVDLGFEITDDFLQNAA